MNSIYVGASVVAPRCASRATLGSRPSGERKIQVPPPLSQINGIRKTIAPALVGQPGTHYEPRAVTPRKQFYQMSSAAP